MAEYCANLRRQRSDVQCRTASALPCPDSENVLDFPTTIDK